MKIEEHISLKPFNTFGFEVETHYFSEITNLSSLRQFLDYLPFLNCPLLIMGAGSNLLFTGDYEGCILKMSTKGIRFQKENEDTTLVTAEAGESWDTFVDQCVEKNLGGLENLALIPGNVGSSPIQNIGAYGVEMKDCFHSLEAIHIRTGRIKTFTRHECEFGYRSSIFKNEIKGQYIILSVTFRLTHNPVLNTSYGAIKAGLEELGITEPKIADVAKVVTNIRRSKLPDPKELGNAGSFFKNPTVSTFDYFRLKGTFENIVGFNQFDGTYKLAAGWLIEQAGWKGYRKGDAGVHSQQALILVNYGKATGQEILSLSKEIMQSVKEMFGIVLEAEVNVVP